MAERNSDLDIPDFLIMSAERRAKAWEGFKPKRAPRQEYQDKLHQEHLRQRKAEARARLDAFVAKRKAEGK